MIGRRAFIAGTAALCVTPARAAEVRLISPADTRAAQQSGALTLVDIREPQEWRDGGVAEGAERIALSDPAILEKFTALTAGDKTAPLALICRSGARSGAWAAELTRRGFTNVYSVNGGMTGRAVAPGWRAVGLPVEQVD